MNKPAKRSQRVDSVIKTCYARLAKKHFERAMDSVGSMADLDCPGKESNIRMRVVEDFLERAGAEATRYTF